MKRGNHKLLEQLEAFEIGDPDAALSFAARLARENDWSVPRALHVVREYKRFLYLTAVAGHPVTPSEDVDQAWHLHMVYTRSYWDKLCGEILHRPLHHEPTSGGPAEGRKFRDWYTLTLASYRTLIGEEPPGDVWPTVAERFTNAGAAVWVDRGQHWIVPKFWPFVASPRLQLPRVNQPGLAALTMLGMVSLLAGCFWREPSISSSVAGTVLFMLIYTGLFAAAVAWASSKVRAWQRKFAPRNAADIAASLHVYEKAFLAGGSERAINAALIKLVRSGAISYEKKLLGHHTIRCSALPVSLEEPMHPLELALLANPAPKNLEAMLQVARPALEAIAYRLSALGLMPLRTEISREKRRVALPFKCLLPLFFLPLVLGFGSGVYLVFLLVAFVATCTTSVHFSKKIDLSWKEKKTTPHYLVRDNYQPLSPQSASPSDTANQVALYGLPAASFMPEAKLIETDQKKCREEKYTSSSGCGSGDTSVGCGTSTGGGCGNSSDEDSGGGSSGCSGGSSGCGSSGCGGGGD